MRTITFILFMFTCAASSAQVNFVLNPDFEDTSYCPAQYDQIDAATNWAGLNMSGGDCLPQYCNTCAIYSGTTVPNNSYFFQYPRSGNGFAEFHPYYDEDDSAFLYIGREYILGKLHTTLLANHVYCVSFYTVLAEASGYAIDRLGVYFDDGSIIGIDSCGYPLTQYIPQVENTNGILADTFNWVKVEGTFVANGTEQYFTIGNFASNANTDTIMRDFSNHFAYYLIDDVSVVETDLDADAGPDTWVVAGDSVLIGRDEVVPGCIWYVNGSVIDSGAGIWAKPTVTTTYVVEQTICGLTKTDTVTVEVWPVNINGVTNGNQVSIYPNPATNQLLIKLDKPIFNKAIITNQLGQQVLSQSLSSKETKLDISTLVSGIYNITLEGENGKEIKRFVKM